MYRNITCAPRQVPLHCNGHTRPVVHLDFGTANDRNYFLISGSKDGRPMLRHGATGDWIGTFEGHKGAVWGVTLNANASLAATAAADFTSKIWSTSTGNILLDLPHGHIVKSVAFDDKTERLVTGGFEKSIRVFNLANLSMAPEILKGHEDTIKKVVFCRNDRCVLSASDDRSLRLWDLSAGKEVMRLDFPNSISSPELSPDGSLFTLACDNKVSFFDIEHFVENKHLELPIKVISATLHPDKHLLVCGGADFKLHKYNCETNEKLDTLRGHFGDIHAVKFSPDGELFASGSEDGTLRLWQTYVGKPYGLWQHA